VYCLRWAVLVHGSPRPASNNQIPICDTPADPARRGGSLVRHPAHLEARLRRSVLDDEVDA